MVSNEDREAAAELLKAHAVDIEKPNANCCVCGVKMSWGGGLRTHRLDVLIAHGWGPKPVVDAGELDGFALRADGGKPASAVMALGNYLRECGIEVTQ